MCHHHASTLQLYSRVNFSRSQSVCFPYYPALPAFHWFGVHLSFDRLTVSFHPSSRVSLIVGRIWFHLSLMSPIGWISWECGNHLTRRTKRAQPNDKGHVESRFLAKGGFFLTRLEMKIFQLFDLSLASRAGGGATTPDFVGYVRERNAQTLILRRKFSLEQRGPRIG